VLLARAWHSFSFVARHEQGPPEASPLGIILCAGGKEEQIELLDLDENDIHVGKYWTQLPSEKLLIQKLSSAIHNAQEPSEKQK
jgi:hypothetical protein